MPDELEYFSYTWFRYKVEKQEGLMDLTTFAVDLRENDRLSTWIMLPDELLSDHICFQSIFRIARIKFVY